LLRAAKELLPNGSRLEIATLEGVPLYNPDIDGPTQPEAVQVLKRAIKRSDAVLIATPEYNHSVSGVLKNALDWVSRPRNASPLIAKSVAVTGASSGAFGAVRAQNDLRQILLEMMALTMGKPEIFFGPGRQQFDDQGNLTDSEKRAQFADFLEAFVEWTRRLQLGDNALD
jgi:chromate reductase